jgi:hypothetical protein
MCRVIEWIVGAVFLTLVLALGIGIGALGLRLNRRGIRRGIYPHRDLPWYLGGVPDVKVDPPPGGERERRRRP